MKHWSRPEPTASQDSSAEPAASKASDPSPSNRVRRFLADTNCDIRVQPVIDPQVAPPADSYEIPRRIREAMFLRMPASCFPYAAAAHRMELDHTKSYHPPARGGPPRQTGIHNLGPMIRLEHRVKTHSRWQVRQTRTRGLALAIAPRLLLPSHQRRNP
jgi:hypothetical protein